MTKVLIEDSTRTRKLLRLTGMGVVGTTEMGAIGTAGPVVALDSLGMSVTIWQEQHAE